MKRMVISYSLQEVVPYINWLYFYHAWQMNRKNDREREGLKTDADNLLREFAEKYHTHAVVVVRGANSDRDDIVLDDNTRLPMLRQQQPDSDGMCWCLADFVRPLEGGVPDKIGIFAATVEPLMEKAYAADPYLKMLSQTLADRLAEATAERLHEQVRKSIWGYAPDECLTIAEMHLEKFQGIRPAVGYPSLPDTSLNFILNQLLSMGDIGIRLTENGAMQPHGSVSGLMMSHPNARYFNLGKIGHDQLADYAKRRGLPMEMARKFLSTSLMNR